MKQFISPIMALLTTACTAQSEVLKTGDLFPRLEARTLSGDAIVFPDSLKGKITVLATGFSELAQDPINTWTEFILKDHPQVEYYEVPIGPRMPSFVSDGIDNAMRKFVPKELHARTATYYGKLRSTYQKQFGVTDTKTCYVFLLDGEGKIRCRSVGALTAEVQSDFNKVIQEIEEGNNGR